jgi:hypothetical protein
VTTVYVYKDDELSVSHTHNPLVLPAFTFIARSGRGTVQTYLTRQQLEEHVTQCQAALRS